MTSSTIASSTDLLNYYGAYSYDILIILIVSFFVYKFVSGRYNK